MPFWIPAAIGAGVGAIKYLGDAEKEKRDRKLAAETIRNSPWTGMQAGPVHEASLFNNLLQGGTAGANFGQQFGSALGMGGDELLSATGGGGGNMQQLSAWAPLMKKYGLAAPVA